MDLAVFEEAVLADMASELLAAKAQPADYKHVHRAADKVRPALKRAALRAFAAGRKALRRSVLEQALTSKNETHVLMLASDAILAVRASLEKPLKEALTAALVATGKVTAKRVRGAVRRGLRAAADVDIDFEFDETEPNALEWVRLHATQTIENMSKTTREKIRGLLDESFQGELDVHDLADEIETIVGDESRAETIARTETMTASNQGQLEAWDQATQAGLLTGTESKVWIVTPDDRLCPVCEPMDGVTVPLDDDFDVEGEQIDAPPAHPNCRCTIGIVAEV